MSRRTIGEYKIVKCIQCIQCSAVKLANPAAIFDGMWPILDGALIESMCSWRVPKLASDNYIYLILPYRKHALTCP